MKVIVRFKDEDDDAELLFTNLDTLLMWFKLHFLGICWSDSGQIIWRHNHTVEPTWILDICND